MQALRGLSRAEVDGNMKLGQRPSNDLLTTTQPPDDDYIIKTALRWGIHAPAQVVASRATICLVAD